MAADLSQVNTEFKIDELYPAAIAEHIQQVIHALPIDPPYFSVDPSRLIPTNDQIGGVTVHLAEITVNGTILNFPIGGRS